MKRLFVAMSLALLVSLAVGAGVAYADHGTDYARGNVDEGPREWRFSASSNFNGTDPQGTVRYMEANDDPNLVITGEVTCLLVSGNTASIVAEVNTVRGGTTFAQSMILSMTDSGKFQGLSDTFRGLLSSSPATGVCPPPGTFQSPVVDGEIIVHDSL
jgi:hypothetical protein